MREIPPNQYRMRTGELATTDAHGNNGVFVLPFRRSKHSSVSLLMCISNIHPDGWEHVSVSVHSKSGKDTGRPATYEEMYLVKQKFWNPDEAVYQLFPPEDIYSAVHPYILHLWKAPEGVPLPPVQHYGPSNGA